MMAWLLFLAPAGDGAQSGNRDALLTEVLGYPNHAHGSTKMKKDLAG